MRTDSRSVTRRRASRAGFTLIEIMIAAGIIVLMIAMALPVFRLISGSRSQEGATNVIAALLGRARADAVGLHQPAGVAFLFNPSTHKSYMAEVQFRDCQYYVSNLPGGYAPGTYCKVSNTPPGGVLAIDYFYECVASTAAKPLLAGGGGWQQVSGPPLDIAADTDLLPLPSGVGVQTICNSTFSGGVRTSDGYLSVGVILFDAHGRVAAAPYEIDDLVNNPATLLSKAGFGGQSFPAAGTAVYAPYNPATYGLAVPARWGVEAQYGLVVYPRDAYEAQGFLAAGTDPLYTTNTAAGLPANYAAPGPSQLAAEQWLDVNATPLLIDRYTGELVRTQ